jgi:formyl-CoA transferase
VWRTGAGLGEDNDLVLREWLGLSEAEIAALAADGVV